MPANKKENFYQNNKEKCQRLIDEIIGEDYGVAQENNLMNNRNRHQFNDKSLIRSSKKALKAVFEDAQLGEEAYNYLSDLKNTDGKTAEKQEADNQEFQKRASDVKELFLANRRKLSSNDGLRPRVVGEVTATKNKALLATAAVTSIAAAASVVGSSYTMLIVGAYASTAMTGYARLRADNAVGNRNSRKKTVTKVNPGKTPNPDSKGVDEKYKGEFRQYKNLKLDYKDLLYEKMTGRYSDNFKVAEANLTHAVDSYVGVMEEMTKGKTQAEATSFVNNEKANMARSDISIEIASFLSGGGKNSHAGKVKESRENSDRSLR